MKKNRIFLAIVFFLLIISVSTNATVIKAVVSDTLPDGTISVGAEFTVDLYMLNDFGNLLGVSIPLVFYSPDQSITNIIHRDVGGKDIKDWRAGQVDLEDYSILQLNGWDGYWNLMNDFYGFSWDGSLPDTLNHTAVSIIGWDQDTDTTLYVSIAFTINESGTFCVDSCDIPGLSPPGVLDWLFDDPNAYFGGPYCWQIGEGDPPSNTWRVNPDGTGDALTIQEGINMAFNGDTVLVADGVYGEMVDFLGKTISLFSENGAANTTIISPVVDCTLFVLPENYDSLSAPMEAESYQNEASDADAPAVLNVTGCDGNTVISGFTINGNHTIRGVYGMTASPVISDCIVEYCVGPYDAGGMFFQNGHPIIKDNIIRFNETPISGGGVFIRLGYGYGKATITGNEFYGNVSGNGPAISLIEGDNAEITRNLAYDNVTTDGSTRRGVYYVHGADIEIINNTSDNNTVGMTVLSSTNVDVRNNIITNCVKGGFEKIDDAGPNINVTHDYNDVWNNQIGDYLGTNPGIHDISVNPMFYVGYYLDQYSPCVDAGDPSPIYNDPDGSRNDMGALPAIMNDQIYVNLMQWQVAQGGNDHWYAVIPEELYWEIADSLAQHAMFEGMNAYLATVASAEENNFISNHVIAGLNPNTDPNQYWLGGFDAGYNDWNWVNGEPFDYTNWYPGEPNNVGIETALAMFANGQWNNSLPNDHFHDLHQYWSVIEWGVGIPDSGDVIPTNEWISVYCGNPILGDVPLSSGDVITAYDPDGVLCGMEIIGNDGSYGFMPIYRDDAYTDFDEGAEPGDVITFNVNDVETSTDPEVIWTENGAIYELCQFFTERCMEIPLHEGWNLISWNVAYADYVENLIAGIEGCVNVIMTFNMGALTYDPDLPEFSTLTTVSHYQGFWLRMNCPAVLEVCGDAIGHNDGIVVLPGWNLVGYWPDEIYSVEEGFSWILNSVQVVLGYDNGGLTWLPELDQFNTLTELKPTFGYWVKMASSDILVYPGFGPYYDSLPVAKTITYPVEPSREWISLFGSNIALDDVELENGSVIEVRTADETLCGQGVYEKGLLKFMPVYGYDSYDEITAEYPAKDDILSISINGVKAYPEITWAGQGERVEIKELFTTKNGSHSMLPDKFALHQNYPNPFNPTTQINCDLPKACEVRLEIYNIMGQRVTTLVDSYLDAGQHSFIWDGKDQSSGMYFYRIEAGDFVESRKMTLVK